MNSKTKKNVDWVLGGLIAALFIFSGIAKLMANEEALSTAAKMGISSTAMKGLAFIEIVSAILFLVPRTGLLGTLLLTAYMGGAIATHLVHGESLVAQCVVQAILWIIAITRFPELKNRLLGSYT